MRYGVAGSSPQFGDEDFLEKIDGQPDPRPGVHA